MKKTKHSRREAPDRRRATDLLPLRPADMQILLTLGDGPLHAYGLAKAGDDGVALGIGSLYRTLNRMRSSGLIEETPEHNAEGPGPARRPWRITAFGREVAAAEARRLETVVATARARRFLTDSEQ